MALTNMKRSQEEIEQQEQPMVNRETYPFGLELMLDRETLDKLEAGSMNVGDKVRVVAVAEVESVRQERMQGEQDERHVTLQITDMELSEVPAEQDAASALFGGES